MNDPQALLNELQQYRLGLDVRLLPFASGERVTFGKQGIRALHERLEELKVQALSVTWLIEEGQRLLGRAHRAQRYWSAQMDDTIGEGLESRVSSMVNRGMASEERRIGHELRALLQRTWRNTFAEEVDELDGIVRALQARAYAVKDERADIRSQFRAIDVTLEIGEV